MESHVGCEGHVGFSMETTAHDAEKNRKSILETDVKSYDAIEKQERKMSEAMPENTSEGKGFDAPAIGVEDTLIVAPRACTCKESKLGHPSQYHQPCVHINLPVRSLRQTVRFVVCACRGDCASDIPEGDGKYSYTYGGPWLPEKCALCSEEHLEYMFKYHNDIKTRMTSDNNLTPEEQKVAKRAVEACQHRK